MKTLAVYCGTSAGIRPEYTAAAAYFGQLVAGRGLTIVYGGGNGGLMGAMANGALQASGRVIGVMPRVVADMGISHKGLTELLAVDSMHDRKRVMAEMADGFVALPGGFGTMEELFEALTWRQLEIHRKPCGLLNVGGFFDGLAGFIRHMSAEGFLPGTEIGRLAVSDDGERLLSLMGI